MNDTEMRLVELLRSAAPELPNDITLATLRAARDTRLQSAARRRAPVRRWLPLIAAGAVVACVLGVVGGVAFASDRSRPSTPAASTGAVPSPSAPLSSAPAPTATGSFVAGAACQSAQLSGSVIGHDSGMSHNLQIIGLRNISSTSCQLSGYANIVPFGSSGIITAVYAEGTYLMTDPGTHVIVLAPGATAQMGIEASTGIDGPQQSITSVDIYPTDGLDKLTVPVALSVTALSGTPIQLNVSALALVNSGPSSSSSNPGSGSTAAGSPQLCSANHLGASTSTRVDSGAGQRRITVILENVGTVPCTLNGYPEQVTAYSGSSGQSPKLSTVTSNDSGAVSPIVLAPEAKASFVLHSTIGYDGAQSSIGTISFALPGIPGGIEYATLPAGMDANGPSGQPIPIDVTAFQAGVGS